MNEFFDDPRHPDRPKHPDFLRLMNVVNRIDGQSLEGGRSSEEIVGEVIDVESVHYMALQRAYRLATETGLPPGPCAAMFLDGFMAGAAFAAEGGHRPA